MTNQEKQMESARLQHDFMQSYNGMCEEVYTVNVKNGFWDEDRNVGEMIALIHSELSEALEGYRKGLQDDHLPQYSSLEVELADTIIRIMDMTHGLNLNVASALLDKLEYNTTRGYKHGKNF